MRTPDSISIGRWFSRFHITGTFVALQAFEGSGVIVTAWRFTVIILKRTYPLWKPHILAFVLYLPMTAVLVLVWGLVLVLGVALLRNHYLYLRQLCGSQPGRQEAEDEGYELGMV
ncbi:hypothetical protein ACJZ2D_013157 [Fusarium nematophilum]